MDKSGIKFFILAFITADVSKEPAWGGVINMSERFYKSSIDHVRSKGGDVIVSFGGANGQELSDVVGNLSELVGKYQKVIDLYSLQRIDFDVEGGALGSKKGVELRNLVIKQLKSQNSKLYVSYTLPVLPTGFTSDGIYLLQNAKMNGAQIDQVNLMTMDYGDSAWLPSRDGNMALAARKCVESVRQQLSELKYDASVSIGVTPMIGRNDVMSEIFTQSDASELNQWINNDKSTHYPIKMKSFWSLTRDNKQTIKMGYAASNDSGVVQEEYEFSRIFLDIVPTYK
ncbi:glycoside hydrolase family 18 protein [Gonapodya prolifera JEL478]|uniref:Glycoside hydrolase family 18 protein n=1 Tax=Gonapodya prolifera (strain JEL478) TaxID=1344416 RepID=A0A138ZWV6_GONPJ|nr:glycoside hydrolase family 18 protein [Gonapodya prolifera JEL478]|eukprot:KXS08977.1 glycoside hydrolase family 18 protein [Gonapodya prolifera JEL478]